MKKVIYTLIGITLLLSCSKDKKSMVGSKEAGIAEYALSLDSAVAYTKRYNNIVSSTLNDSVPIKAYTIRVADIFEALGIPLEDTLKANYNHIRVYMGIDFNDKFRLLLTPVDGANINDGIPGNDVILSGAYYQGAQSADMPIENGEYVLDFTGPCPNSCPVNSPLYQ